MLAKDEGARALLLLTVIDRSGRAWHPARKACRQDDVQPRAPVSATAGSMGPAVEAANGGLPPQHAVATRD